MVSSVDSTVSSCQLMVSGQLLVSYPGSSHIVGLSLCDGVGGSICSQKLLLLLQAGDASHQWKTLRYPPIRVSWSQFQHPILLGADIICLGSLIGGPLSVGLLLSLISPLVMPSLCSCSLCSAIHCICFIIYCKVASVLGLGYGLTAVAMVVSSSDSSTCTLRTGIRTSSLGV